MSVHTLPNQPPQISRQPPLSISERLCNNSSNETWFESTKLECRETIRKTGYKFSLKCKPKNTPEKNRNRHRNIVWLDPPISENVAPKKVKISLHLLNKYLIKSNKQRKILNKNTLKMSYSCMENARQIIKRLNKQSKKQMRDS